MEEEFEIFSWDVKESGTGWNPARDQRDGKRATSVDKFLEEIEDVEEMVVELRNKATLETFTAKVRVARKKELLENPQLLWIRDYQGQTQDEPWAMEILEKYEIEGLDRPITQKRDTRLGERRGFMLKSMLEERQKKEKEEE
jgi:hypothetical protein